MFTLQFYFTLILWYTRSHFRIFILFHHTKQPLALSSLQSFNSSRKDNAMTNCGVNHHSRSLLVFCFVCVRVCQMVDYLLDPAVFKLVNPQAIFFTCFHEDEEEEDFLFCLPRPLPPSRTSSIRSISSCVYQILDFCFGE